MPRTIAIGRQDFEKIRINDNFYVDKTDFIRQWWEAGERIRKYGFAFCGKEVLIGFAEAYLPEFGEQ